eukprot:scaffold48381_cov62-Phaeocystis_antarctica.AAC.4
MASSTLAQATWATADECCSWVPPLPCSPRARREKVRVTSYTFFWPCVLTEPPSMFLSEPSSTFRACSLSRTTATMRPVLLSHDKKSNTRVPNTIFHSRAFDERSLAISVPCVGVRADSARWTESSSSCLAALMLPVVTERREGRSVAGTCACRGPQQS